MKWTDAILIGVAQGIAIIPGISRSGATISMGLFCGLNRELVGKFSFLISIPAILGAMLLEFRGASLNNNLLPILIGTAVAFCVGFFSLNFLMKIIKFGKVANFSYYCWGIGLLIILLT
jgi:undecaprenyl-diphosphatase